MTIYMFKILCVTNRHLLERCFTGKDLEENCEYTFESHIERIAEAKPDGIILREKDLTEAEYKKLAKKVMEICGNSEVPCILHNFVNAALELGCPAIHVPLPVLRTMTEDEKAQFVKIGVSCHSVSDAIEAQGLGAAYITAGHVFDTECKKGLPGRGIEFLKEVCERVSIPVYAIGGISEKNILKVKDANADGACIMSGFMTCKNPKKYRLLNYRMPSEKL